ncbi:hypothetical protein SPI_01477 [Niveomyces insectorum RCEF 264]|uniref:Uncharacterized protein n=1 Tax=Niveomyces insectorum RCEF 264 TaxID=1081102 RepID=A0A167YZX2_9HYPO|nr:hypothetical protein SPI_01477 [Niveomyces insectorum RCEF 264]
MDSDLQFPMITGFNHSHFRTIAEQPPNDGDVESHYSFSDGDADTDDEDAPPDVGGGPQQVLQQVPQQQDIRLDYYQRPDKRNDPTIHYNAHHDLYSLGCVLLEIGLWQTLRNRIVGIADMVPNEAAARIRGLATEEDLDR